MVGVLSEGAQMEAQKFCMKVSTIHALRYLGTRYGVSWINA